MIYLDDNNLDDLISNDITLVDFYANWCGPCKMMDNTLKELESKYKIIKVDTDKFKDIAFKYRIMSIPTIIVFKNKTKIKEISGYKNTLELEEINKED